MNRQRNKTQLPSTDKSYLIFEAFKTIMTIIVLFYINNTFSPGFNWAVIPAIFMSIGLAKKIFVAKANAKKVSESQPEEMMDLREFENEPMMNKNKPWKDSDLV